MVVNTLCLLLEISFSFNLSIVEKMTLSRVIFTGKQYKIQYKIYGISLLMVVHILCLPLEITISFNLP